MANKNELVNDTADREIITTRLLNAPRELVFEAFTKPEHVAKWWGPDGFATTTHEMDVKPGGVWRFMMRGPDGTDYPNKIVYIEVVKPERLVYKHTGDDDNEDEYFQVVVTFEAQGDKTNLTMRAIFKTAAELERVVKEHGAIEGAIQTINHLETYLISMPVG
ncbi:MAG: ATPase [Mucilaginibacter sp.]|nr:ATPase [Mucilaginibacter sp.]